MDYMKNRKFGRLKVIKEISPPINIEYASNIGKWYECECKCGKIIQVPKQSLISGAVSSCGCYRSEIARETLKKNRIKMIENGNTTAPKSKIRYLTYNNETKSLSAWAKELDITREALRQRLKKYTVEEAISMERRNKDGRN